MESGVFRFFQKALVVPPQIPSPEPNLKEITKVWKSDVNTKLELVANDEGLFALVDENDKIDLILAKPALMSRADVDETLMKEAIYTAEVEQEIALIEEKKFLLEFATEEA